MSDAAPLLLFLVLFVLLLPGYPVAFTLGGVSLLFGVFTFGLDFFNLLPLRIWGVMTNYVLLAVPLFVYMGVMLEKSGLAEELLETMALLFGRLRGGLAVAVVIVGALLAATTGIVGATVVTMGLLSLPTMLKRGYSPELTTGTIAASGTLGQIIPPSIVLVLLGSVLNVPIGDLFIGAFVPGMLLVGFYLLWIVLVTRLAPHAAPAMPAEERARFRGAAMVRKVTVAFLPPFLLMVAVLGSIFFGIASPTEAAAVGALGATVLTLLQKRLNLATLRLVMRETTFLTSMVFIILVGATAFGLVFRGLHGDRYLTELILHANLSPHAFLALVMLVVFLAGFFIDFIEIIFIIVPVVAPIFIKMQVDLLWLGILLALNLQTSFLTPPFGFSLFYLKGVAPAEVTTAHIYRGVVPYILLQLLTLLLVIFLPQLATWLPQFMGQ
ncbi:MAG: TRAP transporter large permease subunit [candidate division KSB1 bacterium]|nr:TRAP transporter large permease subunit [candidate division KSB1 bacterium]MDZ7273420.1 TRAP transporter large permease subunit [candidate division KSB1 bacterium]MDZ7286987.1 TRAP transporter large permease subunit [candidate division KSB1 bacterium]MDZ7299660.1 TRAP transporter large permease subunit [candidate division KSB1 bacterium]MDZ7350763.1 TRAP transporter large permease subunit [candidate division KSB1 bacterium]